MNSIATGSKELRLLVLSDQEYQKIFNPELPETPNQQVEDNENDYEEPLPEKLPKLLSEKAAKRFLNRSTTSIWRYVESGQLKKIKRMGRNFYLTEELKKLRDEAPVF